MPGIQLIVLSPTPDYSTFVVTVRITVCQHILFRQLRFALLLHLDGLISPRWEVIGMVLHKQSGRHELWAPGGPPPEPDTEMQQKACGAAGR